MQIEVNDLSFSYNSGTSLEENALENINISIRRGEFVLIGGEIGSGKSTLIRHFNGLLRPGSGKVTVEGMIAHEKHVKAKVGMVFQFPQNQLFGRTVYEEVAFGPSNFGIKGTELEERVTYALELVGINRELHDVSPFRLSGGEMRLVAIAGILAMKPDYLVMDEPLAGLDPKKRNSLLQILKKLHAQGTSVIMASHRIQDLLPLADRVLWMSDGKISFAGSPEEYVNSAVSQIPDITSLMKELRQRGIGVKDDIFTVEDAFNEICRMQREREVRL